MADATARIKKDDPGIGPGPGRYYWEHNISCRQTAAYRTESLWK